MSDTTLLFEQGDYYPIKGNFTIQNVTDVSLIGTPNTNDPTSPVSVIRCLPGHHITFYNVTNLLIKHFKFKECGSFMPDFNKYKSGMSYIHRDYWAAIFIHSCTNVGIINTHIYNPVGYGILAFNVMGNNSIVNVTIVMGRQKKFDGKVCSYGAHLWYRSIHDNTMKSGEIIFSINNIVLKDGCESCVCDSDESAFKMSLQSFTVIVIIKNSNFTNWYGSKNIMIYISSLSPVMIYFYKCKFVSNRVTDHLINFNDDTHCTHEPSTFPKLNFIFDEVIFSHTKLVKNSGLALIRFILSSLCIVHNIHLKFNNMTFYNNELAILEVENLYIGTGRLCQHNLKHNR